MMRALVTGGSRGIGAGICLALAESATARGESASIAICGETESDELDAMSDRIERVGARALPLWGDVADPDVPERLVEEAAQAFGGIDVVVSNAGIAQPAALAELACRDWDRMMNVNLRGPWLLARSSYEHLAQARGSFVAVASMSAEHPHALSGAYTPAKAGLVMLVRTLALEWAPVGIRVNAVSPGMIRTPMTEAMYLDSSTNAARVALVPTGRIGRSEDIAAAVEFLVSPRAAYITGENLTVDGGFSKTVLSQIPGRPRSQ